MYQFSFDLHTTASLLALDFFCLCHRSVSLSAKGDGWTMSCTPKPTAIVQHESLSHINVAVWLVFVRPSLPSVNNLRLHSAAVHYVTNQVLCLSLVFLCWCVICLYVSVICKSSQLVLTHSVLMNRLSASTLVFRFLASNLTHSCTEFNAEDDSLTRVIGHSFLVLAGS